MSATCARHPLEMRSAARGTARLGVQAAPAAASTAQHAQHSKRSTAQHAMPASPVLEVHRLEDAGAEEANVWGEARAGMAWSGTGQEGCSVSEMRTEARIRMAGTAARAKGVAGDGSWSAAVAGVGAAAAE